MQLKKVSIKNVSSFIDFSNPVEFKKGNLIFGTNGSGKSTLVSLLKRLSDRNKPEDLQSFLRNHYSKESENKDIEIVLIFENGTSQKITYNLSTDRIILPTIQLPFKVFNEEYTDKTIGEIIDIDISEDGLVIGEKNKELEGLIKKREGLTKSIENRMKLAEEVVQKASADFSNYTSSQQDISSVISVENLLKKECEYAEDNALIEKRKKLGFSKKDDSAIKKIDKNSFDLSINIGELRSLCHTSILPPVISKEMEVLIKNYTEFFQTGLAIYEADTKNCPFCRRVWTDSDELVSKYRTFLQSTFAKSRKIIKSQIDTLEAFKKKYTDSIINVNMICAALVPAAEKYSIDISGWSELIFDEDVYVEALATLKDKYDHMDKEIELKESLDRFLTKMLDDIDTNNRIIDSVNDYVAKRTGTVRSINSSIAQHLCKQAWSGFSVNRNNIMADQTELSQNEVRISELEDELGQQNATQVIVNDLLQYIGLLDYYVNPQNKLCLRIDRGYDISNEAKRISTAQRKIISLCYFFAEIVSTIKDIRQLKNYILVFDDPVDSADYIYFHSIASVIEKTETILGKIIDKGRIRFGQIFVFTHNSILYDRMNASKWVEYAKTLEKNGSKSELVDATKQINNYLLYIKEIVAFLKTENPNNRRMIYIGNIIRRVLEILASFNNLGSNNFQDMLDGMGKPKLAILANHLSHESFTKVMNPFSSSEELKRACKELFEVIETQHPLQYEAIQKRFNIDEILNEERENP